MRAPDACVFTILILALCGCRSTQGTLSTLRKTDPCFLTAVATSSVTHDRANFDVSTIEDCVELGLLQNPALAEAQFRIQAIRQRIPQVLSLPDPMVNTTTYLAPVQTAAGEQAFGIGINQKITNGERRATQAAIVCDELAAAESNLEMLRIELAEDIRSACYQLMLVQESINIVFSDQKTLEQISEVVLRQYEVNKEVAQQDVLNIQIEQASVENQLTELRQQEKSYKARLVRLLHAQPTLDITITDKFSDLATDEFDFESMIALATQFRPDLKMQLATINRDRKKVHLASLEYKPDFTVGMNWIATSTQGISPVRNGDDALLMGIGFNLPVYRSRVRAGISEAMANRWASEHRLATLQDEVAEEIFDLIAKIESTSTTLSLLRQEIVPTAERTLELSIEEYSGGGTPYVQLIENWRTLLKFRISEVNLQAQLSQNLASLARSLGQLQPI